MLPKDPVILLSYVNTALRDKQIDLSELCKSEGADPADLKAALAAIGYQYDEELRRFQR